MIGQKGIPATYGGIEKHVDEIARRLAARGHDVSVFCRHHYTPAGAEVPGVTLLRRPSIRTKHLDAASHVAWCTLEAMASRYPIVHFHALGPSLFSATTSARSTDATSPSSRTARTCLRRARRGRSIRWV